MILDGRTVVERRYVTLGDPDLVNTEEQLQPNGVDLRLSKLYEVHGKIQVPFEGKLRHELQIAEVDTKENWWHLKPQIGTLYYVDFLESISVPGGFCAILLTRSSLVRSGVDVVSGLWDTGFYGQLGCCLRIHAPISIEWGARLCQVMFHEAAFRGHMYEGQYNGTDSQTAISQ